MVLAVFRYLVSACLAHRQFGMIDAELAEAVADVDWLRAYGLSRMFLTILSYLISALFAHGRIGMLCAVFANLITGFGFADKCVCVLFTIFGYGILLALNKMGF
jgi:hypothetical protein